jgi:hypothetical protein
MADPIRIANCSGFYGDRVSAAKEMVEGGPIDVLTGDWLAELTMLILARTQAKRPGGGYARTFVTQMEQVMGTCLDKGIKVVTNAGGLDPDGCAAAVSEVADKLGLSPSIAYVSGDNLLDRLAELELDHFETGQPIGDPSRFISANAYIGGWGIAEALGMGADIVITGRATDAAVVAGPAAWHHGWGRQDWDRLAGAIVAGHVIECGTQATGGNYSFFTEVAGMARTGFPWAEIAEDGSCVIGKHDGTGGEVSVGTVTSQLLYEIGAPAYLNPDVTSRFDTIQLDQVGPDRVRIHSTKGEPPPPTLKVAMNEIGGHRQDFALALVGLDIEEKAALVEEAFWVACPYGPDDYEEVTVTLERTDKEDPASNAQATAVWRLTLKDPDERRLGRAISDAVNELGLATIPGFFGMGGSPARPYGVYTPAVIDPALVPQHVVFLDGPTTVVESTIEPDETSVEPSPSPTTAVPGGPTRWAPIGLVVGARSGDKGGNANLGVFARDDEAWAWLESYLTVDRLRDLLPEAADLPIDRHAMGNIRSINFLIHGLLQEGVAASTRQDGQAKSLGEWLRARHADIPEALL